MLLTTKQVAALLQVSERQVRDMVTDRLRNGDPRSNPMPVCRLGERVLRFDREDVLAWAKDSKKVKGIVTLVTNSLVVRR